MTKEGPEWLFVQVHMAMWALESYIHDTCPEDEEALDLFDTMYHKLTISLVKLRKHLGIEYPGPDLRVVK